MKQLLFCLALMISATMFQSCGPEDEDANPQPDLQDDAPELPPIDLFLMSFDSYESVDTPGVVSNEIDFRENPSFRNWFHAATNIVFWSTASSAAVAVPAIAYAESFNHTPTATSFTSWEWTYDIQVGLDSYSVVLIGELVGFTAVQWTMNISKAGEFSDFTWLSGTVNLDMTETDWTLYISPENPEPALNIQAERDDQNLSIRYTAVSIDGPIDGEYIEFSSSQDAQYQFAYEILTGGQLIEIDWNAPEVGGQIKDFSFFGDNEFHCWDAERKDVDCE